QILNYTPIGKAATRGANQWNFTYEEGATAFFEKITNAKDKILLSPLLVTEAAYAAIHSNQTYIRSERRLYKGSQRTRAIGEHNYRNIRGEYSVFLEGSVINFDNIDNTCNGFTTVVNTLEKIGNGKSYHYSWGVCI